MDTSLLSLFTIAFYLIFGAVQLVPLKIMRWKPHMLQQNIMLVALVLHAMLLYFGIDLPKGQNLTVFNLFSLGVWLLVLLVWAVSFFKSIELILVILLPFAVVSIALSEWVPGVYIIQAGASAGELFHILLSIFTVAVLCLAGFLAVALAIQERCLRANVTGFFIRKLPPLVAMEKLLFQVVTVGFVLLSLLLVSSFYFFYQVILQHYVLIPKIILVILAWVVFAILLLGRNRWGWRGRLAIYGTFFGVLLLVLVYLSSKILLEGIT